MSLLQRYWRKWRVKYHLQLIFEKLLRPLHLKVAVRLGDGYAVTMPLRKQWTTMQDYIDIFGEDAVRNKHLYSFGADGCPFSECFRILKPGGIFRVMCADADLYYLFWRRCVDAVK